MALYPLQQTSIILPTTYAASTDTEAIDDTDEHTGVDIPCAHIQEKTIYVYATEVVAAGTPGNLWVWIELSPVPSTTSTAYYAAIGGGGGTQVPLSPTIIVASGTNLTVHTATLHWTAHSPYARVVVQTPVAASLPTAYWAVQCLVGGKSN